MPDQAGRSGSSVARAVQLALAAGLIACYLFLPWQGYVTEWSRVPPGDPVPVKVRWISGLQLCSDLAQRAKAPRTFLTVAVLSIPMIIAVVALANAFSNRRPPRKLFASFAAALLILAIANWLQAHGWGRLLYKEWMGHCPIPCGPHPIGFVSCVVLSVGLAACLGWRALRGRQAA
jgi:hypothetical protein